MQNIEAQQQSLISLITILCIERNSNRSYGNLDLIKNQFNPKVSLALFSNIFINETVIHKILTHNIFNIVNSKLYTELDLPNILAHASSMNRLWFKHFF